MLGEEADMRYGEHRLWASVGWGLMAAVSGYLVDLDSQACQFLDGNNKHLKNAKSKPFFLEQSPL